MSSYREYRREITDRKLEILKIRHKIHLENNGFLTKKQKQRLVKLKKKERGTPEADFWYNLKRSAKMALFDLQLISEIADESQLQEIFEPLTIEDYRNMDKGKYYRTDLRYLIENIFSSHSPERSHSDDWRYKIAEDMITVGIGYFRNMPAFQSNLHNRLFQDIIDTISAHVDSTKSSFNY